MMIVNESDDGVECGKDVLPCICNKMMKMNKPVRIILISINHLLTIFEIIIIIIIDRTILYLLWKCYLHKKFILFKQLLLVNLFPIQLFV